MTLKIDAKFEEKLICFKNVKNLMKFDSSTQKSCAFICSYCAKYLMFDLKSTEELSFMTLKGDAKFEEKLTCGLEHDKEYRKFSPEQFKVSKLG